jgi:hypothetical protein
MASNIAARRAAKANRRNAVLAEKRRSDLGVHSLTARVAAAAAAPIRHCLLTAGWQETGMGSLLLVRGITMAHLSVRMFLLDTWCLGVKDTGFRTIDADDLEMALSMGDMSEVDPAYARKMVRNLAAWSASKGFPPHRDFAALERMFGTVNADTCTAEFEFGRDGKPFYVPGPSEAPAQVRQHLAQVSRAIGGTDAFKLVEAEVVDDFEEV